MRRPTRNERRREFLQNGSDLALTPASPDVEIRGLAQVTVAAATREAGMTRGSLYHLWPTQEAFRLDLMRRLNDSPEPPNRDARGGAVVRPSVHVAIGAAIRQLFDDPAFRSRLTFMPYTSSRTVTELLIEGENSMLDEVMLAIDAELEVSGRRLREEFTTDHMRSAVSGIVQGLGVIGLMQGGIADEVDVDLLCTSAQEAVTSLLTHFSVPTG